MYALNVEEKLFTEIREGLNKEMALGNKWFKEEVELTGRRLKLKKWVSQLGGVRETG